MANERTPPWIDDRLEEQEARHVRRVIESQRRSSTPRVTPFISQTGLTGEMSDFNLPINDLLPDDPLTDYVMELENATAAIRTPTPLGPSPPRPAAYVNIPTTSQTTSSTDPFIPPRVQDSTANIGVGATLQTASPPPIRIRNDDDVPSIGFNPRVSPRPLPVGSAPVTQATAAPPSGAVGVATSRPTVGGKQPRRGLIPLPSVTSPPARLVALHRRAQQRRRGRRTTTTTTTTSRARRAATTSPASSLGTPRRSPPSWAGSPGAAAAAGPPGGGDSSDGDSSGSGGSRRPLRGQYDRVVNRQRRRMGRRGAHSVTETHTTTIVYKDGRPPEVHRNSSRHTTPNASDQSGGQLLPLTWFV